MSAEWKGALVLSFTESGRHYLVPNSQEILREDQTKPYVNEIELLTDQLNIIQAENSLLNHLLRQEMERQAVSPDLDTMLGKVENL